ncbi:MAG: hypothetical protein J6Y94_02045, partial [Bacteriovoracaceae bacterium]|nr:hypothetical protein [Bacteriovoracaceae bacterium]
MLALVDADAFFCNCERLGHPAYADRPIVVLSHNDGVIVSADRMAKNLGLKVGRPYFQVRDICQRHQVVVCSSHLDLYQDISTRLMQLLAQEADLEVYSIDEAFLHIPSWHPPTAPHLLSYGEHLMQLIAEHLGIPVSIGMAPTKVLAKAAAYAAKHPTILKELMPQDSSTFFKDPLSAEILFGRGLREVFILPAHLKELTPHPLLTRIKIENLWGIGHASAVELRLQGIATADQLRGYPGLGQLSLPLQQIIFELRGEPVFTQEPSTAQKSFLHSRSFAPPLTTFALVQDTLRSFINKLAVQLREQDSTYQKIKVFWVRGH